MSDRLCARLQLFNRLRMLRVDLRVTRLVQGITVRALPPLPLAEPALEPLFLPDLAVPEPPVPALVPALVPDLAADLAAALRFLFAMN